MAHWPRQEIRPNVSLPAVCSLSLIDLSYREDRSLSPSYINGLILLLVVEPFKPSNQRTLVPFLRRVRAAYLDKNICGFSGFTYEALTTDDSYPRCEVTDALLSLLDILVDGRFGVELKDISLRFRGNRNQQLIDLNASRAARHLCFHLR